MAIWSLRAQIQLFGPPKCVFRHHINSGRFRPKSYVNFSVKIADSRWPTLVFGKLRELKPA